MCRSIKPLNNLEPPATEVEIREAALQYVRKIAGTRAPSRVNQEAFDRAVDEIETASRRLLDDLVATTPPRTREELAARARARFERQNRGPVRSTGPVISRNVIISRRSQLQ